MEHTKVEYDCTIRKSLSTLRHIWENHSPVTPICLTHELEPGKTISEFCVEFLLVQRMRRTRIQSVNEAKSA